jgi:ABC-2 type transport system permease protein
MIQDDLRGMMCVMWKDLRAYYLKPPNISWGILLPLGFLLAFALREGGNLARLAPGLLGLTLLFAATSMEAIVITFERRVGALERLLLAPMRLSALLAGKVLGGMVFGLVMGVVVLVGVLVAFGASGVNVLVLTGAMVLGAAAFSATGALVSVAVSEVFEAQTLANTLRFPMMFLGGVFVPLAEMPGWLQVVARLLPLTYAIEALEIALHGGSPARAVLDLVVLAGYTAVLFVLSVRLLARRLV